MEDISCQMQCLAGYYLGIDIERHTTKCLQCPSNTYSTGNMLRLSNIDKNWGNLPKESQLNCYWISGKKLYSLEIENGYWKSETCKSFTIQQDGSSIRTNLLVAKPHTWNIFELKIDVYLVEDGTVDFVYRKASTLENNVRNGRFRFDVGFYNYLHDDDPASTGQLMRVQLKKGMNELTLYYVFNSGMQTTDLYAEISVFLIVKLNFSSPTFRKKHKNRFIAI